MLETERTIGIGAAPLDLAQKKLMGFDIAIKAAQMQPQIFLLVLVSFDDELACKFMM